MSVGWNGPDPTQNAEAPGTDYDLATRYTVAADINVTAVRVWHGANSGNVARSGRIWSTAGSLLASVAMTNTLPSGWTEFELATPLFVADGSSFDVSYNTVEYYGAVAGGYPVVSADLNLTATAGRLNVTPGSHPDTPVSSFYGIDVVYELAGNLPPEITAVTAVADGLDVAASVTLTDEAPSTVAIRWVWGDGDENVTAAGVTSTTHTYDAAGLYAIAVQATDDGDLTAVAATPVIVRDDGELLDLAAIVDELADRLDAAVPALRAVHRFGPDAKRLEVLPAAIVALPTDAIRYLETYNQGGPAATATIPVVVAVSKVHSRSAHATLAGFLSAAGSSSIRAAIESGVYVHSSSPTCSTGVPDELQIAGDTYLSAVFDVMIMV